MENEASQNQPVPPQEVGRETAPRGKEALTMATNPDALTYATKKIADALIQAELAKLNSMATSRTA